MPPKEVTCSICNQTVPKSQTLQILDGTRACKSHANVEEEARQLKNQITQKLRASIQQHEERKTYTPKTYTEKSPTTTEYQTHCWLCAQEGMELREFFIQSMIATERLLIRGEFNFLTLGADIRKLLGNPRVLIKIPYPEQDPSLVKQIKYKFVRENLHFLRMLYICADCAIQHGFQEEINKMMPEPTFEQIQAMAPVIDLMKPAIREVAIKKENEN